MYTYIHYIVYAITPIHKPASQITRLQPLSKTSPSLRSTNYTLYLRQTAIRHAKPNNLIETQSYRRCAIGNFCFNSIL